MLGDLMGRASRKKNRPRAGDGNLYSKLDLNDITDVLKEFKKVGSGYLTNPETGERYTKDDLFCDVVESIYEYSSEDRGICATKSIAILSLYKNLYHNYYVTSEKIVDFIENQKIKENDVIHLPHVLEEYCPPQKYKYFPQEYYAGAVHLLNRQYSILFFMVRGQPDIKNNDCTLSWMRNEGQRKNNIAYIPIGDCYDTAGAMSLIHEEEININWNIIFNMFLYIDAFPEAIKKGPPPVTIEHGMTPLSNTTIGLSKTIKQMYADRSVSPHMRRGHYRYLQSDRYKKKRFQTVYVRSAMIKGTADHVIDVTEKAEVI